MRQRVEQMFALITLVLFCAALGTPALVLAIRGDLKTTDAEESRSLSARPALPATRAAIVRYPVEVERWLADHFGFRRPLIRLHSHFSYYVMRLSPSPKVILGKDGWLFLKGVPEVDGDPITDYRGTIPLNPYQLERWRWQLEDQKIWCEQNGMTFVYVLVPGKPTLYADRLPGAYANHDRPTARDQFATHMKERLSFPILDLRDALAETARRERVYRKTDTHWNDTGGYRAVAGLVAFIQPVFPNTSIPPEEDWSRENVIYDDGDLSRLIGLPGKVTESMVEWSYPASKVSTTPLMDHPLADVVATQPGDLPSAVMFHDSYGYYVRHIMSEAFRKIRYKWTNLGMELRTIEEYRPDLIIQMMGERRIRLGQRYPVDVQQAGAGQVFGNTGNTAFDLNTENGFEGLKPLDAKTGAGVEGLTFEAFRRGPHFKLPALPDADDKLPIVRFEVETGKECELSLLWNTRYPERWPSHVRREVKAFLRPGHNTVYLPLHDPELTGPVEVVFGPYGGRGILHSVEARLATR